MRFKTMSLGSLLTVMIVVGAVGIGSVRRHPPRIARVLRVGGARGSVTGQPPGECSRSG